MFKEFLRVEKCHAKFCWQRPDGTSHEERFLMTAAAMDKLEHSKGYQLNAPVLRASFCGSPIPASFLQNRPINSYAFQDMVEVFRRIMKAFTDGNEEILPDIYVTGGMYPSEVNPYEKVFGLERPSKKSLPYVYVGMPWHPTVCIYQLREDGYAVMVKDSTSCGGYNSALFGPMKVKLSDELIQRVQLSLQRNPFYEG